MPARGIGWPKILDTIAGAVRSIYTGVRRVSALGLRPPRLHDFRRVPLQLAAANELLQGRQLSNAIASLKPCRHRGEQTASKSNLFGCSSKWLVSSGTVSGEFCQRCPYADRPNEEVPTCHQANTPTRWQRFRAWLYRKGYPPVAIQLLNVGTAFVRHVANGAREVSPERFRKRLEICQSCPTGDYSPIEQRCRACGCSVGHSEWMNKLKWASESCPRSHWGKE